jgi:hypothetical protein
MRDSWEQRIERASTLAARDDSTRALLDIYARLLALQRDCAAALDSAAARLTGSLDRDLDVVGPCVPRILDHLADIGPMRLAEDARRLRDDGSPAIRETLLHGWRSPSDKLFFAKLVLQPYARCLAVHDLHPIDRELPRTDNVCPFCGGAPQLAILHQASESNAGGRSLQCSTCFTVWPFRRILCARCGESDEHKLGYFHSPSFDHLRVDACETCKHYVKTVDLTRLGLAVPIVDEIAGAALDVWAQERGYEKIELNLVGL